MKPTLLKRLKISARGWWMEAMIVCPRDANCAIWSITLRAAKLSRPATYKVISQTL